MNYVIWESTDAFKHGFESPELQAQLKQYPRPFAALLVVYRSAIAASISKYESGLARMCACEG
jgi:heme-degrading monooxygenase HmoA